MRRLLTWVGLLLLLSSTVLAKPPSSSERSLKKLLVDAGRLLDRAEYQRAREMLEAARRSEETQSASRRTRAKLFAYLGRARAELGDFPGMHEAFSRAVELDRRVRLNPKKTSPKILEALEDVRALAGPPERDKPPAKVKPAPKKKGPRKRKTAKKAPPPAATTSPELTYRLDGEPVAFALVRPTVGLVDIPDNAVVYAHVKPGPLSMFSRVEMTRTGTIASIELKLERRPVQLYFEALQGERVLATLGSPTDPITIAIALPPTVLNAWGEGGAEIETSSTATVASKLPKEIQEHEMSPVLWTLPSVLFVATAIVVVAILASSSDACEAEPGFGCTEVRILPLSRR